ncbi:MAG: DUF4404 family protein [Elusimicrobia bacterium]|nr:DUF4404 family protein [Elusimicrobiota bacterium]
MLEDTLKKMEDAVKKLGSLKGKERAEMLSLLSSLKAEVERLSKTHGEQAHSIASLADMAAHEATRRDKSPDLLRHSQEGLALSARGFEASHPQLVDAINELCTMLARIGI